MSNPIAVGDVVQIDPEIPGKTFAGCFGVVTDVHKWGVTLYVALPVVGDTLPDQAFLRVEARYLARVGEAEWMSLDAMPTQGHA